MTLFVMWRLSAVQLRRWTLRQSQRYYCPQFVTPFQSPLNPTDTFTPRHIGPRDEDIESMLATLGVNSLEALVEQCTPASIRDSKSLEDKMVESCPIVTDSSPVEMRVSAVLNSPEVARHGCSEATLLTHMRHIAQLNKIYRSYIGQGYVNTFVPSVILRNVLENPAWYTQYTPYQPEISQGRLESLLNFQTMVTSLTGLDVANASLLDEGTAAAEGMSMAYHAQQGDEKKMVFLVDEACHPQTIAVIQTRAEPLGIQVETGSVEKWSEKWNSAFGLLLAYPNTLGHVKDYRPWLSQAKKEGLVTLAATDLLALTLLTPPGELGFDVALGSAQRFGVPMGFGGPHAAFFACHSRFQRRLPGRLVGVSRDAQGNVAYRLALQTREQHIRREKATSNLCTSQALLANMAAMYCVYHGPKGLKKIAHRVHLMTFILAQHLKQNGVTLLNDKAYFDTLHLRVDNASLFMKRALEKEINLRKVSDKELVICLDETVLLKDLVDLMTLFSGGANQVNVKQVLDQAEELDQVCHFSQGLIRQSAFLSQTVFNRYHSEQEMTRYLHLLQSKDLSLVHAMIPLGSCTMKLNACTEMLPLTWPEWSQLHPFAPRDQALGYKRILMDLSRDLSVMTGLDAMSLQPNSGAQGEYAGLLVIRAYHASRGEDTQRRIVLIPVSAHGTNPASAAMAGYKVQGVQCDAKGNLDLIDLQQQIDKHGAASIAALMVTYPSTFGVFEDTVQRACAMIHAVGGQVYMDGANMNAQIGICSPGQLGADVCHLNLHKTFCIPHGGGGPGMGPIGVKRHLAPFLPQDLMESTKDSSSNAVGPVAAAPFGSALILTISWMYIKLMGGKGLLKATQVALLNANYMAHRLQEAYKILYRHPAHQRVAHEFILDARPFSKCGIEAVDIAKRLQDYSFHPPTMSWPVANTLMVEPTESESKEELDRFCDALLAIRKEIQMIESGQWTKEENPLVKAPHTMQVISQDQWTLPYSRQLAAFPVASLKQQKFWPTVSRLDDVYGDRNLICTCPSVDEVSE